MPRFKTAGSVADKFRRKAQYAYEPKTSDSRPNIRRIEYDSGLYRKNRSLVLKRDGGRCVLCGRGRGDGVRLEVDHIVSVHRGGGSALSNLRTLCQSCHAKRTWEERKREGRERNLRPDAVNQSGPGFYSVLGEEDKRGNRRVIGWEWADTPDPQRHAPVAPPTRWQRYTRASFVGARISRREVGE